MPISPRPAPQPAPRKCARPLLALCVLGACVALAACGSSGSGSTSGTASSNAPAKTKAAGPGSGRFTALRSCLQKQGIALPAPSAATGRPGAPPAGGSGGPGSRGGFQLPKGVTQAQFQAALKKCGGGLRPGGGAFNSASARAGLVKYAACLRQNGIDVPAPNTTGKGPVFSTKGIDTSSSKFKTAQTKCRGDLKGAFAGGGAPPSGAPPAAAQNGAPPLRLGGSAG